MFVHMSGALAEGVFSADVEQVLGEIKNPKRTLSLAAPLSAGIAAVLYVLANVAYFAAIPKKELAESGVIVAGLFFKNVFGDNAGSRALPAFVALSNLGNVLAVSFAHSRVNQGRRSLCCACLDAFAEET